MKSIVYSIASGLILSGVALAADPATESALPKGHPDISQLQAQQQAAPDGQPPAQKSHLSLEEVMRQAKEKGLPAGHPQMPPAGEMPAMPPAGQAPAMPPAPVAATLSVQAIQGTTKGPAVGADPVEVDLLRDGDVVSHIEDKLDATGKLTLKDLPGGADITPVVRITHAGVVYNTSGNPLIAQHGGKVTVKVYEATEEQPEWKIKIRHVMVQPYKDGVQVMEMMGIENPTDRSWIGKADPITGKRATLSVPLPKGAKNVQMMSGFHNTCASVLGDRIVDTDPFVPETSQYQIGYIVPAINGKVDLSVAAPAGIDRMMLFVPDDGSSVSAIGMEDLGAKENDRGGKTHYYKAQGAKAGDSIGVTLTNLPDKALASGEGEDGAAATNALSNDKTPQILAGVGAVLILFIGIAFLFKPSHRKPRIA